MAREINSAMTPSQERLRPHLQPHGSNHHRTLCSPGPTATPLKTPPTRSGVARSPSTSTVHPGCQASLSTAIPGSGPSTVNVVSRKPCTALLAAVEVPSVGSPIPVDSTGGCAEASGSSMICLRATSGDAVSRAPVAFHARTDGPATDAAKMGACPRSN